MSRVSVIIPSYNHEKYVAEAIQSVLDQSYQDFEIVITDDGSSDNTVNVIKSFTDPRIRLFCFSKNQGAAVAANHCLKESKGEFIALLNSDDAFVKDKLEKQVNFLHSNADIGAVFSHAMIVDEDGQNFKNTDHFYQKIFIQPNRTRFEWLRYFFFDLNCLCHPSILIRKECYKDIGYYDPRFAQLPDFDFWIRLCKKYDIFIIPENLVKFRVRDNEANASGERAEVRQRMSVELVQIFSHFLDKEVLEKIVSIFPELKEEVVNLKLHEVMEVAPFLISKLAAHHKLSPIRYFGIDTLYKIFLNENSVKSINRNYSFDFIDFIKITGEQDLFENSNKKIQLERELEQIKNSKFWKFRNKLIRLKNFDFL